MARRALSVLLPVDGSKPSERAVRHVLALHASGTTLRVLLVNVQPEWAPARSREDELEGKRLHLQAADRATRRAKSLLKAAGIPYETRLRVGQAAQAIVKLAREARCDHIVMGMRGLGAVARIVLGSVSLKTVQLADVPVTLVK